MAKKGSCDIYDVDEMCKKCVSCYYSKKPKHVQTAILVIGVILLMVLLVKFVMKKRNAAKTSAEIEPTKEKGGKSLEPIKQVRNMVLNKEKMPTKVAEAKPPSPEDDVRGEINDDDSEHSPELFKLFKAEISVPSVTLEEDDIGETHALYTVQVTAAQEGLEPQTWELKKRYSDFSKLHKGLKMENEKKFEAITSILTDSPFTALPTLPRKTFMKHLDESFLDKRRLALDAYLNQIVTLSSLSNSESFRKFCEC